MDSETMKSYNVIVEDGSGCLFQSMISKEYTYILTAKHLFEGNRINQNGRPGSYSKNEGDKINISQIIFNGNNWTKKPIDFIFQRNINYFPHNEADIAILKIGYIEGFDAIFSDYEIDGKIDYELCGFPNIRRGNNQSVIDEYTSHAIERFIAPSDYSHIAQVFQGFNKNNIEGMSGGPFLKISGSRISILGIQSRMISTQLPAGQIGFVPMKYFDEIVNYEDNKNELTPFLPYYMQSFDFLRKEILKLEEALSQNFKSKINNVITEQVKLIGVCPNELYTSKIRKSLLANSENESILLTKEIWISWFEYLIVLCVLLEKKIDLQEVEHFFNKKRLIHSGTDGSWIEILPEILRSDLKHLEKNGTVVVSTKKPPSGRKRIQKGYIEDIANPMINELTIDKVSELNKIEEIIHIKAFEIDCIIQNEKTLDGFSNFQIKEMIEELKKKIYEFF
ncbi:ABC-three component system protein [Dokdonia ponticola]|uniref:ABC-three component system protein n=1 Tax=Dokdonia ponticola TaxID=2041041 RepID=A0ABV9HVA7_9FLAO